MESLEGWVVGCWYLVMDMLVIVRMNIYFLFLFDLNCRAILSTAAWWDRYGHWDKQTNNHKVI